MQNQLYNENLPIWQEMDDVCAGERAIKAKRTQYLPMIHCHQDECENLKRYDSYLMRAVFYPVTKSTLQTNIGLAFSDDPSFEPDGMDFLKHDADGAGSSLYQLTQIALSHLLKYGRGGFFVDYPQVEGGASLSDVQRGVRPTVVLYSAKDIVNWRVKKVGGTYKTSLVVLEERNYIEDPSNKFSDKLQKSYRILMLDENNHYCVQTMIDDVFSEVVYPRNARGQLWDEIPFICIGSQSNDFAIDEIPLEPIASINLAHYRNSAEYEQSLFYAGQIQPVITELDEHWRNWLVENGMMLGSSAPLMLPAGAKFEFVQANETSIPKQGMDDKLNYMQLLGAKVSEVSNAIKTATQADNEQMTKHSVLSLCISNINEAMESVLFWCSEYFGSGDKAKYTIKQDFANGKLSLDELKFWQSEYAAGNISEETYWYIKQTGKQPEIDIEEERQRIVAQREGSL